MELRRGATTTPTNCDMLESICAACAITRWGWSGGRDTAGAMSSRRTVSMVSTKSR